MRLPTLTWMLLSSSYVLAAYVQFQDCLNPGPGDRNGLDSDAHLTLKPESLRAWIETVEDDRAQLELAIVGAFPQEAACLNVGHDAVASSVRVASLGNPGLYDGQVENQTCHDESSASSHARFNVIYDIAPPRPLDTFFLTVNLRTQDNVSFGCLDAPLTPDIGVPTDQAVTWIPVAILVSVILAALWREVTTLSIDQADHLEPLLRESSRTHITRVADYISYLQFIFFSCALSLRYPGFLQPVVIHLSWSTLMLRAGVVAHDPWYDGVKDGLYEVNGTFGGTPGMELMTQVLGGTVTMDTWLNMAALASMVFILLTIVVAMGERLSWARDWFGARNSLVFRDMGDGSVKVTLWAVLRLFCSYLLLPLVAWSTYQLDHAALLPVYHTAAAAAVVCALVLLICWAMWRSSPRSMGYLLIDSSKEHQNPTASSRTQNMHSAGVFVLLFVRGAIIGGLQLAGTVQLLVLVATEIVQMSLHGLVYRTGPFSSRASTLSSIRLVVLALESGFLPDATGHEARMALGYIVLTIHTLVLAVVFLLPSLSEVGGLAKGSFVVISSGDDQHENVQPQIYGLRQLMQRPTNPPTHPLPVASSETPPSSRLSSPPPPSRYPPSEDQRSYFRQPRPRTPSADVASRASNSTNLESCSAPETSVSGSGVPHSRSEGSVDVIHEERCEPSPLDPNVDYSFREADMYYVRPRRPSFRVENAQKRTGFLEWTSWLRGLKGT